MRAVGLDGRVAPHTRIRRRKPHLEALFIGLMTGAAGETKFADMFLVAVWNGLLGGRQREPFFWGDVAASLGPYRHNGCRAHQENEKS